ncbi:MAG: thioredoxin family protein [Phycisphaerae bacterium]|nr:thioredoxin family protein [Phycisphaerae bacterium]
MDWKPIFEEALPYKKFLEAHGDRQRDLPRWRNVYEQVMITPEQQSVLAGFKRLMRVLCLAGAWCGDCVSQCPILQRICESTDCKIDLRFIDRDVRSDVTEELSVCAGKRVPVVVFMTEDYHECGRYGDRTLSRYRQMASELGGAACSSGITTADQLATVTREWLNEFERIQYMLRTSARLRQIHGD